VFSFAGHFVKSFTMRPTADWLASRIKALLARTLVFRNALRDKFCMRMPLAVMPSNDHLGKLPAGDQKCQAILVGRSCCSAQILPSARRNGADSVGIVYTAALLPVSTHVFT
jgi:hypothetical protein